jgi:uncharacterized membrane protein
LASLGWGFPSRRSANRAKHREGAADGGAANQGAALARARGRASSREEATGRAYPAPFPSTGRASPFAEEEIVLFEYEDYRGPIPHPRIIEGYQRTIPNGGQQVIDLVREEAEHRHQMEPLRLRLGFRAHVTGQAFAFVLALVIVLAGAWLIDRDHDLVGYATLLVGGAGLIQAVVRGRAPDRSRRRREIEGVEGPGMGTTGTTGQIEASAAAEAAA